MPKKNEKSQTNIVAFRSKDLKERISTLATLDDRTQSQMARLLMKRAVALAEKEFGVAKQV